MRILVSDLLWHRTGICGRLECKCLRRCLPEQSEREPLGGLGEIATCWPNKLQLSFTEVMVLGTSGLSRAIRRRGGGVALGVVVVVDLLLLTIVAVAIAGAVALARGFVVLLAVGCVDVIASFGRGYVVLVVVILIVVIVVETVIDGEDVLQGMVVVLLVYFDLAQIVVEEARGEMVEVTLANELEFGTDQVFNVDLRIVRFDVGHVEDVMLGHLDDQGGMSLGVVSGALSVMSIIF